MIKAYEIRLPNSFLARLTNPSLLNKKWSIISINDLNKRPASPPKNPIKIAITSSFISRWNRYVDRRLYVLNTFF
ncbi:MAG: hypothetical protein ACFFAU_18145 [Candidatus Hodarchaeota archaeon]